MIYFLDILLYKKCEQQLQNTSIFMYNLNQFLIMLIIVNCST